MNTLFTILRERVYQLWKEIGERGDVQSYLPLFRPVAPYAGAEALSPVTMVGVMLALIISSGVTLASLGVLLASVLVLYLLFTEVLGISIEVKPGPF